LHSRSLFKMWLVIHQLLLCFSEFFFAFSFVSFQIRYFAFQICKFIFKMSLFMFKTRNILLIVKTVFPVVLLELSGLVIVNSAQRRRLLALWILKHLRVLSLLERAPHLVVPGGLVAFFNHLESFIKSLSSGLDLLGKQVFVLGFGVEVDGFLGTGLGEVGGLVGTLRREGVAQEFSGELILFWLFLTLPGSPCPLPLSPCLKSIGLNRILGALRLSWIKSQFVNRTMKRRILISGQILLL